MVKPPFFAGDMCILFNCTRVTEDESMKLMMLMEVGDFTLKYNG